ncbi:hypothetical protein [Pseudomonas arsenicoxydans]|uniref:Uncharacterized protein n=1 Tax=Pseudomonas arsenicoxydans TaxID=702115 RepID=A0A502HL22_9PSED|nr:hypothetical protein [Pseudomonas arsenicoxydans]TPG75381.1 hypothetical protein EAH78_21240 [Pseudomonas arsenicoxydans]
MNSKVLIKAVLLLTLVTSAAISSAQAASLTNVSQAAAALPVSNTMGFHAYVAADSDTQSVAADGQLKDALHVQGLAGTASSYLSQGNAVPIPAAAWLFSSALFGFVLFANRRKV